MKKINLRFVSLAMLIFASAPPALAVEPDLNVDAMPLAEITVRGNKLISTDQILAATRLQPGEKITLAAARDSLVAIFKMGYFDKKSMQVNPEIASNGLNLTYVVVENPTLKSLAFANNREITDVEIMPLFKDQVGKPENAIKLADCITRLEADYQRQGFLLAHVSDLKESESGDLVLVISEGVIDRINIDVDDPALKKTISDQLLVKIGDVFNEHRLTNNLRAVCKSGRFSDIRRGLKPSSADPNHYDLTITAAAKAASISSSTFK